MSVLARNRKQLGVLAFLVVVLVLLRPFILRKLRGLLQLFGRRKLTHPIPKYNLREHSSEGAVRTIFRRQSQTHDTSLILLQYVAVVVVCRANRSQEVTAGDAKPYPCVCTRETCKVVSDAKSSRLFCHMLFLRTVQVKLC